jgi:predicted nucleic acid-binding protein
VTPVVVDASALVEYVLSTPRAAQWASLIQRRDVDLHMPALADVEFASAMVRLIVRRVITADRAVEALTDLAELPLNRHGHLALLPRVLSLRTNFSVYDACYVSLADAELITGDQKLATAVRRHTAVRVVAV